MSKTDTSQHRHFRVRMCKLQKGRGRYRKSTSTYRTLDYPDVGPGFTASDVAQSALIDHRIDDLDADDGISVEVRRV